LAYVDVSGTRDKDEHGMEPKVEATSCFLEEERQGRGREDAREHQM
jgi:hypothetical protein